MALGTKERARLGWPLFCRKIFILKTIMFHEVTTVLNERKHLKMVIRSVPDSVSLNFRPNRVARPHCFTPHRTFLIEHSSNAGAASWPEQRASLIRVRAGLAQAKSWPSWAGSGVLGRAAGWYLLPTPPTGASRGLPWSLLRGARPGFCLEGLVYRLGCVVLGQCSPVLLIALWRRFPAETNNIGI